MRILVTGAARGLGLHLASQAARRNHGVIAAVRAESDTSQLEQLTLDYPGRIRVIRMDVTSEEDVSAAAGLVEKEYGSLDGLVNNAAIQIAREDTIETLDLGDVLATLEVNLVGAMRVVQKLLPALGRGQQACVINISSEAGTIVNAYPSNYPYAISKTALNMFTERLRAHLTDKNIRVYAVHPGWMRTALGGPDAPADPAVVAGGLLDLLEGRTRTTSKISFIDATGRPMPL